MSGSVRTAATAAAAPDKSPDRIAGMFDAIAPRYDLLNRLLSCGIDRWWRKRAIDSLALTGREVLVDVATGTGDVALEACAPRRGQARAARVVGVDFARAMLVLGVGKVQAAGESGRIVLVHGDAMRLPVAGASADAVTIAFGIRNVHTASVACAEMARVLKPGGRLAILEFGVPRVPGLRGVYQWYFRAVLPRVGRLVSGHTGAYSYLPASVGTFTPPAEFTRMLEAAGFESVHADPLTIGIVYLYTARRR
jgi:demethylmenaquinone methyltransferase/2-methoxy-6-polyprenyl-1,4-benzoquinol methylase